MTLIITNW